MISRVWLAIGLAVVVAAGIVAFVSYGHGGSSGTAAQQLQSWVSSTQLGQDIGTLQDDGMNVARALHDHKDATAVRTICAAMANDAQTFNEQLPSPDSSITQLLARAYGLDYDAAEACYKAGTANRSLLAQASGDRAKASGLFVRVLDRVGSVTGHSVSTTTTTVPNSTGTSIL
jgi:hypothetical protein